MTLFYHVQQRVQHLHGLQNMEDRLMPNGKKKQNNEPTKGTSNEQVRKLMDLGYEGIIPIPFGTKNPGRRGWQNAPLKPDDADERVPAGQNWNLGLLNDKTNAVDVDIPDPELAAAVADLEPEAWTNAPLRIGEWPKCVRWFKPGNASGTKRARFKPEADPDRKLKDGRPAPKKVEIEIRTGPGMQTVALGRHPSGCDYRYEGPSVLAVPFSELPSLMQADVDTYLRRAESAFEAAGYVYAKEGDAARAMYPENNQKEPKVAPVYERETEGPIPLYNYRSTVISVLLDGPNRLDRERWISFAHCLQTIFGKDDLEMREAWIEFSGLYDGEQKEGEAERVWDTTAELHGVHTRESFWKLLDEAGIGTSRVKMHGVQDDGHDPRPLSMKIRLGEASEDDRPPWDDRTDEDGLFTQYGVRMDEVDTASIPDPKIILESTIPADACTLVGPGQSRKSTFLNVIAAHIILGKPIGNRRVEHPGPVAVVTKEDRRDTVLKRMHNYLHSSGFTRDEIDRVRAGFHVVDMRKAPISRTRLATVTSGQVTENEGLVDLWISGAQKRKLALVTFDPLAYFGAGESKVNDSEMAVMAIATRMAEETDCGVVFTHHVSQEAARNKVIDQYAGRGGSALGENARSVNVQHRLTPKMAEVYGLPDGIPMEWVEANRVPIIVTPKFNLAEEPETCLFMVTGQKGDYWNIQICEGKPVMGGASTGSRGTDAEAARTRIEELHRALLRKIAGWQDDDSYRRSKDDVATDKVLHKEVGTGRNELRSVLQILLETGMLKTVDGVKSTGGRPPKLLSITDKGRERLKANTEDEEQRLPVS